MKTAYEIAMERLQQAAGPTKKLSGAQKAEIAEIEKKYEAKTAEHKLAVESKLAAATTAEDVERLRGELSAGLASLEARREKEKEAVWSA